MYSSTEWRPVYPDTYTIVYTTTDGQVIYKHVGEKREEPPELETGDTAALDDFLGGFARKVE